MTASRLTPSQAPLPSFRLSTSLLWILSIAAAGAAFAAKSPPAGPYDVTRERMGDFEPKAMGWVNTTDGRHIACTYEKDKRRFVSFDGKPGPPFFDVASAGICISPDGKRVAYFAKTNPYPPGPGVNAVSAGVEHGVGDRWAAVIDQQVGTDYDACVPFPIAFSPDSRRVAYGAVKGSKAFVVLDGQSGREHDAVGSAVVFSPDSKRHAYVARDGDKETVVVDGEAGPALLEIAPSSLSFSPDSRHVNYVGLQLGSLPVMVMDGTPGPSYSVIGRNPVWSPDGAHLAYDVTDKGKSFVVLDGVKGPEFEDVADSTLCFNPEDGRQA